MGNDWSLGSLSLPYVARAGLLSINSAQVPTSKPPSATNMCNFLTSCCMSIQLDALAFQVHEFIVSISITTAIITTAGCTGEKLASSNAHRLDGQARKLLEN